MSHFQGIEHYQPASSTYHLLPFRFSPLQQEKYLLTNLAGEYLIVERPILLDLLAHRLTSESPTYRMLRARHFLTDECTSIAPTLLSIKLRTRYRRLAEFTGLHLFVVTLRCEHACP